MVGDGDDRKSGEIDPGKILSKAIIDAEEVYLPGMYISVTVYSISHAKRVTTFPNICPLVLITLH